MTVLSARVDSWLWAVRVFKTRSAATAATRSGHIRVNGDRAKAAQQVKAGDEVWVRIAGFDRILIVREVISKRVGAVVAVEAYTDTSPPLPAPEAVAMLPRRDRGAGQSTERERRNAEKLRCRLPDTLNLPPSKPGYRQNMGRFSDSWRSHLLTTFSGDSSGRPQWVSHMEQGDDAGFFGPDSASWAVHGGMGTLVAGIRALLMQTLHPGAMAGVHDWSRYKEDPLGRLSGTIQWLITVTFAGTEQARLESSRVGKYHARVVGTYIDAQGVERPYTAGDPELLSWVHAVFTDAFLGCHELWGPPIPGGADQYVREWATAGELVGVQEPPRSRAELKAQIDGFRPVLTSDDRVLEAVRFIRNPPLRRSMMPAYRVLFAGAVASLPEEHRKLLGLRRSPLPVIWATGVVLRSVGRILGTSSTSEKAARVRLARIERERDSV